MLKVRNIPRPRCSARQATLTRAWLPEEAALIVVVVVTVPGPVVVVWRRRRPVVAVPRRRGPVVGMPRRRRPVVGVPRRRRPVVGVPRRRPAVAGAAVIGNKILREGDGFGLRRCRRIAGERQAEQKRHGSCHEAGEESHDVLHLLCCGRTHLVQPQCRAWHCGTCQ